MSEQQYFKSANAIAKFNKTANAIAKHPQMSIIRDAIAKMSAELDNDTVPFVVRVVLEHEQRTEARERKEAEAEQPKPEAPKAKAPKAQKPEAGTVSDVDILKADVAGLKSDIRDLVSLMKQNVKAVRS